MVEQIEERLERRPEVTEGDGGVVNRQQIQALGGRQGKTIGERRHAAWRCGRRSC